MARLPQSHAGPPAGRNFDFFLIFQKCPKKAPQGPRGPGALFSVIFRIFLPYFWAPQGPLGAPWGGPGGPLGPPIFLILGCFPIRWLSVAICLGFKDAVPIGGPYVALLTL